MWRAQCGAIQQFHLCIACVVVDIYRMVVLESTLGFIFGGYTHTHTHAGRVLLLMLNWTKCDFYALSSVHSHHWIKIYFWTVSERNERKKRTFDNVVFWYTDYVRFPSPFFLSTTFNFSNKSRLFLFYEFFWKNIRSHNNLAASNAMLESASNRFASRQCVNMCVYVLVHKTRVYASF